MIVRITISLIGLALQGCTFSGQIAEAAVAYNKAVEQAHNEQLLLNITRAMHRRPMHFTAISQIRGNLKGSVQLGGSFPFGGDAASSFRADTAGSLSSSPSFDIAILDSQKFMSGITTPLSMETVKYYWDQGWPKDMLVYLLVRKIEDLPDEKRREAAPALSNYPAGQYDLKEFNVGLSHVWGWKIKSVPVREPIGPELSPASADNLEYLTGAHEAGLVVEETGPKTGKYQLKKPGTEYRFAGRVVFAPVTSPDNAYLSNDKYAVFSHTSEHDYKTFNFTIPAGVTIVRVEVRVEWHTPDACDTGSLTVRLLDNSGNQIGTKRVTPTIGGSPDDTTDFTHVLGGPRDRWGASLTDPIVNDPEFGVSILYTKTAGGKGNRAFLDNVDITVYHTNGGPPPPSKGFNDPTANVARPRIPEEWEIIVSATDGAARQEGPKEAKDRARLYIRSPESILYYLGELMRQESKESRDFAADRPMVMLDGELQPLFVARERRATDRDALASIQYEGKEYIIPATESGRSMHCLSLVTQLLALHKSREELPTTTTVVVTGN